MTRRVSKDQAERREAFPSDTRRADKATAGRTSTMQTPVHIRAIGLEAGPSTRDYIRQRLGLKLGKFAIEIRRISVRLVDESGPEGAPSRICRVKVLLDPTSDVIVEHEAPDIETAIDGALDRTERAVRRTLKKARAHRG